MKVVPEKKAVPDLRFSEFRGEWDERRGRELFGSSRAKGEDALPMYSVTLNNGLVPRSSLERNHPDADSSDNLRVAPGDLVYNMMRMWQGAVGRADTECMVSPAYVVLRPKKSIDSKFFEYVLQKKRSIYDLWAYSYGLTDDRLRLYYRDFGQINFVVPSLKEQQKISEFLEVVDSKLSALKRQLDLLREYKRGIVQQVFSQRLRFKKDDGSEFPSWEVRTLGDFFAERSEKNYGDLELLSVKMTGGVVKRTEGDSRTNASEDRSNYKLVMPNDIAYNSMRMWQGASGLSPYKGIVSPAYTVIVPLEGSDPLFFSYLFKFPPLVFMFRRFSQGLTSDTWNLKYPAFSGIKWNVPVSIDEQRKIARFLSSIDSKLEFIENKIDKIDDFKRGLLQKMLV